MKQTLINKQNGELGFDIIPIDNEILSNHIIRKNHYSILLLLEGILELNINFSSHSIAAKSLICISPYHPHQFLKGENISGYMLCFHPDFFCTYKHQHEISVEGSLFNNNYQLPFFIVNDDSTMKSLLGLMQEELGKQDIAQHQVLVAYLKAFLVTALRIKQEYDRSIELTCETSFVLTRLRETIERCYDQKHSPADYAHVLHISPKALGKLVKKYFNKTLSELIAQRIIIEAKRELYLTSKSVKEIAFLLGYSDEYYFSRFFKQQAGISPQIFRNTVGFAKAELHSS